MKHLNEEYNDLQYDGLPEGASTKPVMTDKERAAYDLLLDQAQAKNEELQQAIWDGNKKEVARLKREFNTLSKKIVKAADGKVYKY